MRGQWRPQRSPLQRANLVVCPETARVNCAATLQSRSAAAPQTMTDGECHGRWIRPQGPNYTPSGTFLVSIVSPGRTGNSCLGPSGTGKYRMANGEWLLGYFVEGRPRPRKGGALPGSGLALPRPGRIHRSLFRFARAVSDLHLNSHGTSGSAYYLWSWPTTPPQSCPVRDDATWAPTRSMAAARTSGWVFQGGAT
ncbi:MAG: hypothetical protein KatS3mg077_2534 [Candidatus Binatia bacterium]|nr:MAG: hypothetical protein KatS3mg077_2534 [Candidatus Binatia bacterium]